MTAFPAAAGVVLAIALLAAPGARAQTAPAAPATPIVDEVVAEREGRPVTSVARSGSWLSTTSPLTLADG